MYQQNIMLHAVKLKTRTIRRGLRTIRRGCRFFPLNIMQVMTVFSFIKIIKSVKRINDCMRMQVTVLGRYAPQQFTCMRGKERKEKKKEKRRSQRCRRSAGNPQIPGATPSSGAVTDPTAGTDLRSISSTRDSPPAAGPRYIYVTLCI